MKKIILTLILTLTIGVSSSIAQRVERVVINSVTYALFDMRNLANAGRGNSSNLVFEDVNQGATVPSYQTWDPNTSLAKQFLVAPVDLAKMSWDNAVAACEAYNTGSGATGSVGNWRLPTLKEGKLIYIFNKTALYNIYPDSKLHGSLQYWSNWWQKYIITLAGGAKYCYTVRMDGLSTTLNATDTVNGGVRCVKTYEPQHLASN